MTSIFFYPAWLFPGCLFCALINSHLRFSESQEGVVCIGFSFRFWNLVLFVFLMVNGKFSIISNHSSPIIYVSMWLLLFLRFFKTSSCQQICFECLFELFSAVLPNHLTESLNSVVVNFALFFIFFSLFLQRQIVCLNINTCLL